MRRDDAAFEGNGKRGEHVRRVAHRLPVGGGAHDDADQRFHRGILAGRPQPRPHGRFNPLSRKEKRNPQKVPCADREWCGAGVMPEDQGMLDTLGNAIRLPAAEFPTTPALSPEGDSVLQDEDYSMHLPRFATRRARIPALLFVFFAFAAGFTDRDASADDAKLQEARELLKRHPLIDGHNDLPNVIREKGNPPRDVVAYDLNRRTAGDTDIARLREGGVGGQFWSVWIPSLPDVGKRGFARVQLEQIDIALRVIERYPADLRLALSADEIEQANAAGCIASLLGIEGGHAIENSLGALRAYYRLGARYMTLTHFNGNDWADSATESPRHGGLTNFGQEVVREMNRLGMVVDLSHVSTDTMNDALDIAEAPVMFSHSSALALTASPRNVPDSVLSRLAKNGGVVMVDFISEFNVIGPEHGQWRAGFEAATGGIKLGDARYDAAVKEYSVDHPEPKATIQDVAAHIEHVRDVAGI